MSHEPYEVTFWVTPHLNLYHASKVISGLCELAREGFINLRTTRPPIPVDGFPLCLEVRSCSGKKKRLMLDLLDHGDRFFPEAFATADIYFKRSYHPADIAKLPPDAQTKIVPFGLNFACINRAARGQFIKLAFKKHTSPVFRSPWKKLRLLLRDLNLLRGLPPASSFEQNPLAPREATVLFQTRVWPPEETTEDLDKINHERVSLVRSLKTEFGDRFVGGVVADKYSHQFCPDVLAETNIRRFHYSQLVRNGTIGIYTRGLHQSLAFKLSEYLAAGMCIVGEPLLFRLPVPLEPNIHYLPFASHEECIAQCRYLLENPAAAASMRQANIQYYRMAVEPKAHLREVLKQTIGDPK
jgi:hypothetical protein